MNYLLKTRRGDHLIPIQTPEKLWNHPAFNRELKTAILITGWFSNINSTMENDALETVWEAYKCRGNYNFVVSVDLVFSKGNRNFLTLFLFA